MVSGALAALPTMVRRLAEGNRRTTGPASIAGRGSWAFGHARRAGSTATGTSTVNVPSRSVRRTMTDRSSRMAKIVSWG
jgi:hypothetical protein